MSTSGEFHTTPSQNGAVTAPDEVRVARTPGFVAASHRDEDHRASEQRKLKLSQRVRHYDVVCSDLQTRLDAAHARRDGLPDHARGWPLPMYVLLAALTIGIEYVPAHMFTQIFYQTGWVQTALTLTFTAIGVVVAIFLGELLRRMRVPEGSHAIDHIFVAVVGAVAVGYLVIGYWLRIAFTSTSASFANAAAQRASGDGGASGASLGLSPSMEAIALTAIAAIGMVLAVVSTYHRESFESFGVHSRIRKLHGDLTANQQYKNTNLADLDRVEKSAGTAAAAAAHGEAPHA